MVATTKETGEYPVITDLKNFDASSGGMLERIIFNSRRLVIAVFLLVTCLLGYQASKLIVNANFERMIPTSHPYIKNYLENKEELRGLGNSIRIAVENTEGDIFNAEYLNVLQKVNDAVYLLPGVDRPWMRSLWTPLVRWSEVTEDGFDGGPVMPDEINDSPQAMEQLRANIAKSGIVGSLVAANLKSSIVQVPLLDHYADTGKAIDYRALSQSINELVRANETEKIKIHVVGFAKLAGDLIDGLGQVISFSAISVFIAAVLVYFYTRCFRTTLLLVLIALLGVVNLLGAMNLLGYELDPYSMLAPFLIFAIGLSHGAQKMNGIMHDIGRGTHKYVAARYTFRRLFIAGLTALLTNVVGFAVLLMIDIPVIKDLAVTTSLGVGILIFTKLVIIPVALSYTGGSKTAAQRSLIQQEQESRGGGLGSRVADILCKLTDRRWAVPTVLLAGVLALVAFSASSKIQIGDLDKGAPELHPDSRYNQDNAFMNANYGATSDQFAVIVKTPPMKCDSYGALLETGRLAWTLERTEGVLGTTSLFSNSLKMLRGLNEGNPKAGSLVNQEQRLGTATQKIMNESPDAISPKCEAVPLIAYLEDHKADTLNRVLKTVEEFSTKHSQQDLQFLPAAGTAGIEAVTNIVVEESNRKMLVLLYASISILCFVAFRSWRAVVVALIPLVITSALCEAIMVWRGMGIKVATLPVIALGVGVGIDYALYLLSIQLDAQRRGMSLANAYRKAFLSTGRVITMIGWTMAAGVITWAWSPIKFQADMGILLAFMFLWNMIGSLILIPALSHFLLNNKLPKPNSVAVPLSAASAVSA